MRHDPILKTDSHSEVDIAALWPVGVSAAPLPVTELDRTPAFAPTPSAPDVPGGVGVLIAGSYAALIGAFALASAGSAESIFMVVVAALFVLVFFTIPRLFLAIEPKAKRRPSLDRFLYDGMDTLTGRSSGPAALVQMLIVPVSLTLGVLAMAVAASIYL